MRCCKPSPSQATRNSESACKEIRSNSSLGFLMNYIKIWEGPKNQEAVLFIKHFKEKFKLLRSKKKQQRKVKMKKRVKWTLIKKRKRKGKIAIKGNQSNLKSLFNVFHSCKFVLFFILIYRYY